MFSTTKKNKFGTNNNASTISSSSPPLPSTPLPLDWRLFSEEEEGEEEEEEYKEEEEEEEDEEEGKTEEGLGYLPCSLHPDSPFEKKWLWTDQPTDKWTKPLIEMRERI